MNEINVLLMQKAFRPAKGGASRRMEEFATLLSRQDFASVTVMTLDDQNCAYPTDLNVVRVNGNPQHFLARWKMVLMAGWTLIFRMNSKRLLYINAPFVECGLLVRFARMIGTRVVLHLTLMGQDSPSDLRRHSRYPQWLVRRMIHGLSCADLVLTMGEGLRDDAIRYGWPAWRVKCLPHPKSEDIYHPVLEESEKYELRRSLGLPEDSFVCGFVGYIVPRKGIAELIQAWKGFHASHPQAKLALCGPMEENTANWADSIMKMLDPGSFVYVGTLSASQVGDFLRTLDLFVLPSHLEGLPSALVEAMMTGLACVVSSIKGSTADLIEDGVSGILITPKSPAEIVAALDRLLKDESLRKTMGQQAYLRSKPFHSKTATEVLLHSFLGTEIKDF